jgi:serine/threonine protein kinase
MRNVEKYMNFLVCRFMAPEMVIMLNQSSSEKMGYTNAVDWWSLGVTMFKLLTGFRPFSEENFNSFVGMVPTVNGRRAPPGLPEYAILFQQIPFPRYLSREARDIISKLLDVNEKTRLGSGPKGLRNLKNHPFFASIDWDKLEQRHMQPPYVPGAKKVEEMPLYPNFDTMMKELGKEEWLSNKPTEDDQKYFDNW